MIWHSENRDRVLEALDVGQECGLTSERAAERLQSFGPNKLREKKSRTFLGRFLDQMKDAMVIILLIAAAVSLGLSIYNHFTGGEADWIEPIVIIAIVLINALLGVIQESKAEAALEALKNMSAPEARVLRDGKLQTMKSTELVPGDIVEMEAGDLVPADCRLLRSASFQCDEAALTGESVPASKDADASVTEIAPLGDRVNMAYSGCAVSYGHARGVVVETGMNTEMGKIATMLEDEEETATPLQEKLAHLGKTLGFLALGICVVIFIVGLIDRLPPLDMFMTAISLAVAAIPEGLPAIVTIVLAIGVQRMEPKNAIDRRLPADQTLRSATLLSSDKTGTLTQNRMTLVKVFDGCETLPITGGAPDSALALIRLATLCTDCTVQVIDGAEKHLGDPTETAIVAAALKNGMPKDQLTAEHPRLGEIPFDSDRKLMTTINLIHGQQVVIVKGAPDILLERCVSGDLKAAAAANEAMARDALRVLALGYKTIDEMPMDCRPEELEQGLTFGGLLGMIDPPRPEVTASIKECDTAGIRTVMITGDHVVTASAIAKELGILHDESEAITGAELAKLSDDELYERIRQYRVYARVTPSDKIRIVKAWQRAGEIVAMTGDGVNDAPSIKSADIGVGMGITGTDVTKNVADMVLADDNFATIVGAVAEGRRIYDNIRKSIQFLLASNMSEVLSIFAATMLGFVILQPVHLLWINLITDSFPALALGMERPEADIMQRKPRKTDDGIFAGGLGIDMLYQGVILAGLTLTAYFIGHYIEAGVWEITTSPDGTTMAFLTLSMAEIFHSFNMRSQRDSLLHMKYMNPALIWSSIASFAATTLVIYVPFLADAFEFEHISLTEYAIALGLAFLVIPIVEIIKFFQRKATAANAR